MSEFIMPNPQEYTNKKHSSPYLEQAKEKSAELGKDSDMYPYTVKATMEGCTIELNGMKHTNDVEDETIELLKERFYDFIATAKSPMLFIEGGMRDVVTLDEDTSLVKHGEPGFITKLAQEKNIEVRSPEPPDIEIVNKLLSKFPAEEVTQYFFERMLYQWYRMKDSDQNIGDLERYVRAGVLDIVGKVKGMETVTTDYEYYIDKVEERFGKKLEDMKEDEIRSKLNFDVSPFGNRVSAYASDIRDKYILDQIREAAIAGHDVFVVYGSHHVFIWEQMLKEQAD